MKKFILLIIFILSLNAQTVTLKLIETSDVHGQLFPYDFINDKPAENSLAQIYTYVKQERAKPNQEVILLDNGDIMQGQPIVYYYNFERIDTTHILASMMNYMEYDAATIGNHDIETGHPVYDKLNSEFNFPWMAANAINEKTGEPYFQPYTIIEKQGIKIAILGLITPHIPHWLPQKIWEGMYFEDMIESAQRWVDILNEKEKPDLLVGLFHAGVDYTYGGVGEDSYKNENASELVAKQVKGFDIVFVGHDHQGWNMLVKNDFENDVLILGTKGYSSSIAEAEIVFEMNDETGNWDKKISGNLIETNSLEPDDDFIKHFNYAFKETKEYVSKPIGELAETITARNSIFGDDSFSDLIHTVQLDLTGADISFTAPLSLHAELNKGEIYVRDMFDLYKYENLLYTIEMSGKEIEDYLEYSYSLWFNEMKNKEDHLLIFETDEEGNLKWSERSKTPMLQNRYYNFDSAEGIEYTVDLSKSIGDRVAIKNLTGGSPFEKNTIYKVAINSYRGNGGGGHLTKGAGIPLDKLSQRILTSTEKDLRFYLMKWIEQQELINVKATNNWNVVPEQWYKTAKEKDKELLFNTTK